MANELYNRVNDNVPNISIYGVLRPEKSKISPSIAKYYTPNLKKVHTDFLKNPTFNNATDFRKQLNQTIGDLLSKNKKSGLDTADRTALENAINIKGRLDKDIHSFFDKIGKPELKEAYQDANRFYEQEVAPYHDSKIFQIAKGKITKPNNLTTIFKNPEPDVQKVIEDLGSPAKHKILYHELGKSNRREPEKLLKQYEKLGDQGLQDYITADLEHLMDKLQGRMSAKNVVNTLGGIGIGAATMPHFGATIYPELVAGGGLGGYTVPRLIRSIQKNVPLGKAIEPIKKGTKKIYPITAKAVLANALKGGS